MTTHDDITSRRKALLARSLTRIVAHYQARADETIRSAGFGDYQGAHKQVLFHLELEGNRITTLADRAQISVQAMGKIVRDLEVKGYVARHKDPSDGRAHIILLTERGISFFETTLRVLEAHEQEMADILGVDAYERIRQEAAHWVEVIDPQGF